MLVVRGLEADIPRLMQKLHSGIAKHKVVCIRGTNDTTIQTILKGRHTCLFFSNLDFDVVRLQSALSSRQWNGTRPVVVCVRCDQWMSTIAPLIKNRQSKQAVVFVTDGTFSPIVSRLSDVTVTVGALPPDTATLLRHAYAGYEALVATIGVEATLAQIHASERKTLMVSEMMSEVDVLVRHVPDDLAAHCIPPMGTIKYIPQAALARKRAENHRLVQLVQPFVAKTTHCLRNTWETMEYISYAHAIHTSPGILQFPRDDAEDPRFIQNVNDKLRVLASGMWKSDGPASSRPTRCRVSTMSPSSQKRMKPPCKLERPYKRVRIAIDTAD